MSFTRAMARVNDTARPSDSDQARRDGATPFTARSVAAEEMQRWLEAHIDALREDSAPTRDQQAGESPRLYALVAQEHISAQVVAQHHIHPVMAELL